MPYQQSRCRMQNSLLPKYVGGVCGYGSNLADITSFQRGYRMPYQQSRYRMHNSLLPKYVGGVCGYGSNLADITSFQRGYRISKVAAVYTASIPYLL